MNYLISAATILPPIISALIAVWAILVAKKTIYENKETAKKSVADTAYQTYLQLAMEHPDFAKGYTAKSKNDPQYDQYVWYIARMLFCFEQIIQINENKTDKTWTDTLIKHLKFHSNHFHVTKVVEQKLYCDPILDLILLSKI